MIDIPAALQARLDAGATTLAWCWVLTRRDGARFGFTDHDRPLQAAGVACSPDTGLSSGDMRVESSAAPARGAVFGVLNAAVITDADLANGLWDGARVEVYRVDWTDPALNFKTFTGELGATTRGASGFEAEVAGLSARLNRTIGRVFAQRCDAELGDARCGVDLDASGRRIDGVIAASPTGAAIEVSGVHGVADGALTHGTVEWLAGANTGAVLRIVAHQTRSDLAVLDLEPAPAQPPEPGDAVRVTVGCDKRFETCRTVFANAARFRGCPHMPGNDVVLRSAASEPVRDGGAR